MTDKYKQPIPITDRIPLSCLGYGDAAHVIIIVNSTKAVREAWDDTFAAQRQEGETAKGFAARVAKIRFDLLPFMITEVMLSSTFGFAPLTPSDAEKLDNVDDRIIPLCVQEVTERAQSRMLDAARSFRTERLARLTGTKPQEKAHADSNNGVESDEDN